MILFSLSLRSFPGKMKVILKVEKADKKKKKYYYSIFAVEERLSDEVTCQGAHRKF